MHKLSLNMHGYLGTCKENWRNPVVSIILTNVFIKWTVVGKFSAICLKVLVRVVQLSYKTPGKARLVLEIFTKSAKLFTGPLIVCIQPGFNLVSSTSI